MAYGPKINNTIREQAYQILKEQILNGTLKEGERIQEIRIAEELNISRSPVREALKILDGEALVKSIPNKGIFVRKVTTEDIKNAFELRTLLECYSIRKLCANATPEELSVFQDILNELENAYRDDENDRYHHCDEQLHNTIIHMSKNDLLIATSERIFQYTHRLRIRRLSIAIRREKSMPEHRRIIQAILRRDAEAACRDDTEHLKNVLEGILSISDGIRKSENI